MNDLGKLITKIATGDDVLRANYNSTYKKWFGAVDINIGLEITEIERYSDVINFRDVVRYRLKDANGDCYTLYKDDFEHVQFNIYEEKKFNNIAEISNVYFDNYYMVQLICTDRINPVKITTYYYKLTIQYDNCVFAGGLPSGGDYTSCIHLGVNQL